MTALGKFKPVPLPRGSIGRFRLQI